MKVAGVVLIDGLTEAGDTSAQLRISEQLEHGPLPLQVNWGSYLPVSQDGSVETVEVFPYFFGIPPEANPGRAGFELLHIGEARAEYSSFVTMRSKLAANIVEDAKQIGIHARYSPFSRDKRTVLLAAPSPEARDQLVRQATLGKYGATRLTHLRDPVAGWNVPKSTAENFALVGWCHGALHAALSHAGMDVAQTMTDRVRLPAPAEHHALRLQQLSPRLRSVVMRGKIPVMYLKDAAYDARRFPSKSMAISRVCELLTRFCAELSPSNGGPILLISDHNSEVGRDETVPGATAIGAVGGGESLALPLNRVDQADVAATLKLVS